MHFLVYKKIYFMNKEKIFVICQQYFLILFFFPLFCTFTGFHDKISIGLTQFSNILQQEISLIELKIAKKIFTKQISH